jgi:hypothetical protein
MSTGQGPFPNCLAISWQDGTDTDYMYWSPTGLFVKLIVNDNGGIGGYEFNQLSQKQTAMPWIPLLLLDDESPQACIDYDRDSYYRQTRCGTKKDCDDRDNSIHPGATEICDDYKDNNCDGQVDEGCNPDGPIAYYPLNGNPIDASRNGNDGNEHGGISYAAGKVALAASLDGNNDYIEIPKVDLDGASFTIAAYVYLRDSSRNCIYSNGEASGGADDGIRYFGVNENGYLIFNMGISNFSDATGTKNVGLNEWHHVALVANKDNNKGFFYLDGQKDSTDGFDISAIWGHLNTNVGHHIGAFPIASNQTKRAYFNGKIDELRIYNHALSKPEIQQLYNVN